MTNRDDRSRMRTLANNRGWAVQKGALLDRFEHPNGDLITAEYAGNGRLLLAGRGDTANRAVDAVTLGDWIVEAWRAQWAADSAARAATPPAAVATLVETRHPDSARTSGIPMVHRTYRIDGEAPLLVELPNHIAGGGTYRVVTVLAVTQADTRPGSHRTHSTWVNLRRQTKSGRDFTRGGFASVTLDRLTTEISTPVGKAVRAALDAVAQPVEIEAGQALPGWVVTRTVFAENAAAMHDEPARFLVTSNLIVTKLPRRRGEQGPAHFEVAVRNVDTDLADTWELPIGTRLVRFEW